MAKYYKKIKRHLPFYVNMLCYSYAKQCNYFYFCADAGTGVCTEKGTIGESRCRKAKGLNGEGFAAGQPAAELHILFRNPQTGKGGFL